MHKQEFEEQPWFMGGHGPLDHNFHGLEDRLRSFRAGRGMIEPAILETLLEKPMHGYEIISKIEQRSHGMWRPSPGSIYPTLQLLEEKDLVRVIETDGKKTYELTALGRKEAKSTQKKLGTLWHDRFSDDKSHRDTHRELRKTFGLMRIIYRKGTTEQKQALFDVMNKFSETVEAIAGEKL